MTRAPPSAAVSRWRARAQNSAPCRPTRRARRVFPSRCCAIAAARPIVPGVWSGSVTEASFARPPRLAMRRYLAIFLPFLPTERWRSRQAGGSPMTRSPSHWSKGKTMRKGFTRSIQPPWIRGWRPVWLWRTLAPVCRIFPSPTPTDVRTAGFFSPWPRIASFIRPLRPWTSRMASSSTSRAARICSAARRAFCPARSRIWRRLDFPPARRWADARCRTRSGAFFGGRRFLSR